MDDLFFPHLIRNPSNSHKPDMALESELVSRGKHIVAGIDEAGRGPLAGPVVAAAVVLETDNIPEGINDSKKLTFGQRQKLYNSICKRGIVAISVVNNYTIDKINIRQATLQSMCQAEASLAVRPDWCLIDGRDIPPDLANKSTAVIKGDQYCSSIAAASIVAKVVRDKIMIQAAKMYPEYGFEKHKGYATAYHRQALDKHRACPLHRLSFAPISQNK